MTYHRHYLSLSQTRQIYNKHRILEFNFVSLMWKEEESFPSINLSTTLQPHTHTRFYICWHSDKSHTEFKHLPWTIQAICRKNPSDWNPRVPSPVPSSLGITLELIHNTYAWAQKAWDGKKKNQTVLQWHSHKDNQSSFVRQDLMQYVSQQMLVLGRAMWT